MKTDDHRKKDLLLVVDCGTQSLRTLIFDTKGTLLAGRKQEYKPYVSPRPGWAEQDAGIFWKALVEGCQGLKKEYPDCFEKIAGMGVTSQRDTMINMDREGQPLR
ncbi:MAG: FGGY family carbohydrate kinase, partial [Spirochaetales bacterium]|nr:FGGY family carbohydrate kinase [Spirochaetales bacterium]